MLPVTNVLNTLLKKTRLYFPLILIFSFSTMAAKRTVDQDGGGDHTTLEDAIKAAQTGDTVNIVGSDIDTFDVNWPANYNPIIHLMSDKNDPDSFPVVRFKGWNNYWTNHGGTNRFERIVLDSCGTIILSNTNRKCIIDRCVIQNFTSTVFTLRDNATDYLLITNTIFRNNATIFPRIANKNNNGPYGSAINCTFFNNESVQAENAISSQQVNQQKFIDITNCIFAGNTVNLADADLKNVYTYNMLPTTESGWGEGSVYSNNPGFVREDPVAVSEFKLTTGSPAVDAGTDEGAPLTDIAGNSRSSTDIGAFEWIPTVFGDYTWDIDAAAGIQPGDGTWGTDAFWTQNGTTLVAWPGAGNSATFGGSDGSYTITVSGTQAVDSISFLNNGYTLTGGTLNFGNKNGLLVASGKTATIKSVITGTGGLNIQAKDTSSRAILILEGANTYTGVTTIGRNIRLNVNSMSNGGSPGSIGASTNAAANLVIDGGQYRLTGGASSTNRLFTLTEKNGYLYSSGSGAMRFTDTGAIAFSGSGARILEFGGNFTGDTNSFSPRIGNGNGGATALEKTGPSIWILNGANTFTGGVTIKEGILKAGNEQAFGNFDNTITVDSGAALDVNGLDLRGYTKGIVINGQVDENTGAVINTGAEQTSAIRKISLGSDATFGNKGNRFDIGRGYADSVCIEGNNNTLTIVTNYMGLLGKARSLKELIIKSGQLSVENDSAAGTAPITINSGATFVSWGDRVFHNDINIKNNGSLLSPYDTGHTFTTVHNGTITVDGNATIRNPVRKNTMTIAGVITGSGNVTVSGDGGVVIFSNNNTYTGTTTVTLCTLQIGDGGTTGSILTNVTNNHVLRFNRSNAYTYGRVISGPGTVIKTGTGTLTLSGANIYTGPTTVSSGTLNVTGSLASGSAVRVIGTLTGTGTVAGTVDASGGTIAPGDGGPGTLTTGALTLNNYSVLNFELGTSRDSIRVNGNLILDGTLNVNALTGFDAGIYTLITCSGTLTDNGLELGSMPSGKDYAISAGDGSVTLTVTNSTVVTNPPTDISLSMDTVLEGQSSGAVVGILTAEDEDTDPADLTYTLVSGTGSTDNALFTIVKDTLKTATVLDYKTKSLLSIRIQVADPEGGKYSKTLMLHVIANPGIMVQPHDTTVIAGRNASFLVRVTGDPPFVYKWVKTKGTVVDTLDDDSLLTLVSVEQTDSGTTYKCIVSNAAGSVTSRSAVLKVISLPWITSQPQDIAASDGDTAVTFSITAEGTEPLRYKWLRNGTDSIGGSSYLRLDGVTLDDDGSFFICEVTNPATDLADTVVRSNTAYLTVAPAPPLITEQPQHVTVEEGKNAVFRIKVTGTPPFAYSWYKDGGTEVSDADSLVVKDVTKSDSGTSFICVVVNSAGAVTSDTAILHVGSVAPIVTKNPTDYEIHEGGTAVFTAKATGTAELIYTWYLKETGDSVGSGDTLKLKNVSKSDSGNVYYCVIRNKEGQAETKTAVLHVLDALAAPEITLHPVSQAKYVGDSVTFSVNATGNPAPEYQWYKNGLPVTGQTGKSLKLTNIKLSDDSSEIYCVVYNSEGTVFSDTAILTIIPPPIAGFSVEPIAGFVPLTVSFADTSQGEITSRKWYFGDGDSSTQRNPVYVYETAGKFQVKLVVTNPSGKDSTSDTITVFAEGANPVVITASYLKDRDIRIVLKNLSAIEDAFPSAWVDSLGIWVEEGKLPASPSTSVRLKAYSKKKLIDAGDSFVDTLTLPGDGDLYGLMNALIFLDRSNSEFDSLNGCMVFMKDTIHPDNPLSISGSHLGGDSAQIRFGNVSSIDDEKADSIGFWYGTDTSSLSFSSSNSHWFSIDEITGGSQYTFKISDELFKEEAVEIWLAVVVKGTNGRLSPVVKSSFSTLTVSVDNPIILSAVALSASRIMLSWPKIDDQEVTRIRLWKGEKAVPDGPVIPTGFDSVGVSPSDTIYIFTSLKSETRYYFGAQVFKDGKWSPVTSNARASAVTLEPSDTTRVENCIRLDPPVFDTLSATISLSWCLDSSCYMDDLDVGISYSNVHFPELKLYIGQIVEVTSECQSVVLKLKENTSILFDTTYYIELWLRKTDGEWSNPTELSKAVVRTLPFTREIVTFFRPGEDTVKAFNSTVVLWKDKSFPSTALTTDTIAVFKPGRSYKGMIPVGTGFSFMKKQPTPAFFVGLRYTELPKGYSADDVRIYRDNGSTLILEHGTIVDSNSKTLAVKTSDLRYPFILLIDTMPPVVTFRDTGSIAESERTLRDTIGLEDNISNLYWKYIYGKGNEAPSYEKLDTLEGESETIRLSVSSDLKVISQDYGLRAYLIVSDGAHVDTFNLSRRVRREKSDPIRTTAKEWYPLKVTSELAYTSPESVIEKLLEKDVKEYDNRYIRMFRWVDDGRNESSDRWVEYADSNSSLFKFIPGRLIWVKTLHNQAMDFGEGITLSLKSNYQITLPPGEWTDIGLPHRFGIRLADIMESTGKCDSLHFYSWAKDSSDRRFYANGIFVPGFPDKQNRNMELKFENDGGFTVFNPYKDTIRLKIPPIPLAMSKERPLSKKSKDDKTWSVKMICRTDSGVRLPDLYCGYAPGNTFCDYPLVPSFSSAKVAIFHREANRWYGHHIAGKFNGRLAREIAFTNTGDKPVKISFDLERAGVFPADLEASVLNPESGDWRSSGTVTVASGQTEYRWLVIADQSYMEQFRENTLMFKYSLKPVYPNPFRSVANIRYTVPAGSKETLRFTLHDAMGRRLWEKTIEGSRLSMGEHRVTWNGTDIRGKKVQAGAYFLSLSVLDGKKKVIKKFQAKLTYIP